MVRKYRIVPHGTTFWKVQSRLEWEREFGWFWKKKVQLNSDWRTETEFLSTEEEAEDFIDKRIQWDAEYAEYKKRCEQWKNANSTREYP